MTIDLNEAISYFGWIFGTVLAWLKNHVFVIGVVHFDMFTLAMSWIALEIVWYFLILPLIHGVYDD